MKKAETHQLIIGNQHFHIQGSDTETLKRVAKIMGLKYDSLEPSKLSASQGIIKVWAIGKLYDYLNANQ